MPFVSAYTLAALQIHSIRHWTQMQLGWPAEAQILLSMFSCTYRSLIFDLFSQDSKSIAADIYAAVRPTGEEPELAGSFPSLTVDLRPYQRRAAGWMISREVGRICSSRCAAQAFQEISLPQISVTHVTSSVLCSLLISGCR